MEIVPREVRPAPPFSEEIRTVPKADWMALPISVPVAEPRMPRSAAALEVPAAATERVPAAAAVRLMALAPAAAGAGALAAGAGLDGAVAAPRGLGGAGGAVGGGLGG